MEKCEDAVRARAYEDFVKTKKKNIVCFADRQGLIYFLKIYGKRQVYWNGKRVCIQQINYDFQDQHSKITG